jgi:hypothetical protein
MNPLIFWNELSELPLAENVTDGNARMNRLVDALAALRRAVPGAPAPRLRSHEPLHASPLAPGYTVADWQTRADETRRRLFLQLATSSPLLRHDDGNRPMDRYGCADCWIDDASAKGLRAAWAVDELAVSLESDLRWEGPVVAADLEFIDDDGEPSRSPVEIRHLANVGHVTVHATWLAERIRRSVVDGDDLWARRGVLLPNVEFCKEVERQLARLDAGSDQFRQVVARLFRLDTTIAEWARTEVRRTIDKDFLPYKCTPETPQTLKEEADDHTATRSDGTKHLFKWHVRFTPGEGRLFFDVDPKLGRGVVGYIGIKKGGRLT